MSASHDEDRLLDHDYDGIQEYDNPMPRWWLYIFWGSIVWAALFWFNVPGIGVGKGMIADYDASDGGCRGRVPADAAYRPRRRPVAGHGKPTRRRSALARRSSMHELRGLPRRRRRRRHRPQPDRRLLDPRRIAGGDLHDGRTMASSPRACPPGARA